MADYAYSNTARYVAKYNANEYTHSIMIRAASSEAAENGVPGLLESLFTTIAVVLPTDFQWIDALWYPALSEIGIQAERPGNIVGQGIPDKADSPNFISFMGRSRQGSRAKIAVTGISVPPRSVIGKDYRASSGELGWVNAAIAVLDAAAFVVAVDGAPVNWKDYVNYGVNAYYQRQLRK